jgi:single-stranded DNA-binding protein
MFEQQITLHGRVVDAPTEKVIPREDGKTSTLVEFGLACDNNVATGTNKEGKKIKTSFYQVQIWNEKMSSALKSSLTKGKMLQVRGEPNNHFYYAKEGGHKITVPRVNAETILMIELPARKAAEATAEA